MIIHDASNGHLTLITQTDHSNLVGELAAHWGNADFAAPEPYDSVVRAPRCSTTTAGSATRPRRS